MSFEKHQFEVGGEKVALRHVPEIGPEDMNAAEDLVKSDPVLKADMLSHTMIDNGFTNMRGEKLDPGDFLYARRAILEAGRAQAEALAVKSRSPLAYEAAMAIGSDDTDQVVMLGGERDGDEESGDTRAA